MALSDEFKKIVKEAVAEGLNEFFSKDDPPQDDVPDDDGGPQIYEVKWVKNGIRAKVRPEPDKGVNEIEHGFVYPPTKDGNRGTLITDVSVVLANDRKWWKMQIYNSWDLKTIGLVGYILQKDAVIE